MALALALAAFSLSFAAFWRAFSNSFCLLSNSHFFFVASNFSWCSLFAASCFCLRNSICDLFLNSGVGVPTKTAADVLKFDALKGLSASALSSLNRLPFTSITTYFRFWSAQRLLSAPLTVPSSIAQTPKPISGLSLEVLAGLSLGGCGPQLFSAQSRMARSLISVYPGFFSRYMSSQSKLPWSGRLTGKSTSPSSVASYVVTSASVFKADPTMWHLKGSEHIGSGPKFVCSVMHLKATVGNMGLPCKLSGRACGCATRTPFLKRLIVLQFGLPFSRLMRHATTSPANNLSLTLARVALPLNRPVESKETLVSESSSNDEPAIEKPIFI
mmetsp:Transcript_7707/g.21624  ORF Transcript_7707/g.21624 Transcript_7707/m.21624 type:complete len:329 (-) Transcript_7707:314-1300(-)